MGCSNCNSNQTGTSNIKAPCKVCELVDKDNGEKFVTYCETCKAYICSTCWNNWPRRSLAFGKELVTKFKRVKK